MDHTGKTENSPRELFPPRQILTQKDEKEHEKKAQPQNEDVHKEIQF